ncbi:MAG: bacillithiol biosynthesis deacetylase BshB1 [Ferruginibacter sp.]
MKIDVLAFGVHPDDVELSCSGVLMIEKNIGKTTGIIDLTEGELGTRGTAETRRQEAAASAKILGVDTRDNLKLADGFFKNDQESQLRVIEVIRKYKPEIIICNAPEDRHPDHGRSAELISDAAFLSGLKKIETEENGSSQEAWRPKYTLNFIQDRYLKPDFVIDTTAVFERKLESILAFKTQFHNPEIDGPQTYISSPDFLDSVIYRAKMFGKMIGVKYAEGFISKKTIGLSSFDALIKQNT